MNTDIDYWKECIGQAADDCELKLTPGQLECLADAASNGHEHYGMAFYSPPSGDYAASVEREWQQRYADLEKRLKDFEDRAYKAIRRVGRIGDDRFVSIDKHGYVEVMAR
jgi:hypothetical protein